MPSGVRAGAKPHQIYFESAKGARMTDIDGNSYIDYVAGWGPLLLGHAHPAVTAAAHAQLDRGIMFGGGSREEVLAAESFLEALGWAGRMLWTNTGTEAVQIALRLARAHTSRDVVVKLGGGYHGWHDTVMASYYNYGRGGQPIPQSLGQPASSIQDLRIGLYGDLEQLAGLFAAEPGKIAAVLVDPTSSNTGAVTPPPGYLEGLRRMCDENGTVLIFDEVVSGLRLGLSGASGRFGVTPDLATFGKAIGSGFPVSAVAGRADIIDLVTKGAMHGGTFNGNPLSMSAVIATLETLSQPGVYERIEQNASALADGIQAAANSAGRDVHVHHLGAVALVGPGLTQLNGPDDWMVADWDYWSAQVIPAMLAHGIYLLPGGRLFLSTEHGEAETAETVAAFEKVFAELPAPKMRTAA
ncbi:aspartate aminotransferase family protein [Blastococcus sp. SYSU D00695]